MKEIGPIIVGLVLFAAILLALHNNGTLFKPVTGGLGPTKSLSPNKNIGKVQGAHINGANNTSPFAGDIDIDDIVEPGTFAGSEYIILSTSTDEPVNITGWSIVSDVTGNKAVLGNASNLPLIDSEKAIVVNGYQKVIISSDKSPIGIAFRTNACTGYIEDKQNFNPKLEMRCPDLDNDNLPNQIEDSDTCMNYINSLSTCEVPPKSLPNMPQYCEDFIKENASYRGCVNLYKNSKNFFGKEWRVFLKSNMPLWKKDKDGKSNQEILRLIDAQGRTVDTFTY